MVGRQIILATGDILRPNIFEWAKPFFVLSPAQTSSMGMRVQRNHNKQRGDCARRDKLAVQMKAGQGDPLVMAAQMVSLSLSCRNRIAGAPHAQSIKAIK